MRQNEAPPIEPVGRHGAYLAKKCFEAATKDNMPITYPIDLKLPHSPFTEGLLSSGVRFEAKIAGRLASEVIDHTAVVVIPEPERTAEGRSWEDKRQKETDTWNAYTDPAVRFIFNARIGGHFEGLLSDYLGVQTTDVNRVSEPDAIELGPVMPNGLRAMRFIDVKDHKTLSGKSAKPKDYFVSSLSAPFFTATEQRPFFGTFNSEDWMQLSHYYSHGQTLGLTDVDHSMWSAVIGREEVLIWARLDEVSFMADADDGITRVRTPVLDIYRVAFAHGIRVALNGKQRDTVPTTPNLSAPERKEECKQCPWRTVCTSELKAYEGSGHITLLPGVTPKRAKPYYAAGVSSIEALAAMATHSDVKGIKTEHVLQARVTRSGAVHRAPGVNAVGIERADIEVDFDCENDAQVYMWGIRTTMVTDIGVLTSTRTYDDYSETNELGVFLDTWNYFRAVQDFATTENKTLRFYHYSHYERSAIRKLVEKLAVKYTSITGVPTLHEVEEFFTSGLVVDLYPIVEKRLMWPTEAHSLKALAVFAGFSWRDESPSGDASMVWYRAGCSDPDADVRAANIDRLRSYNEDDVQAQLALRNWIRDNEADFASADALAR